ncbi:MAG: hydrogenase expression/formation protein HypE, partial [Spirochaetota bacterium]
MITLSGEVILLAHGDGGLLTHQLIRALFLHYFNNEMLNPLTDAALFYVPPGRMAVSTDSYVVDPIFFPGGDIGRLAVCGTINDLAVSGARPLYLTASFIIEEGFSLIDLEKIVVSMAKTCQETKVKIIAGDTKVVARGQADKIFITTTGVGYLAPEVNLGYHRLQPGDQVLVNGCLGNHGLAILLERETLGLKNEIISDCAPLNGLARKLLDFKGAKLMRDLTRGGLVTALKEIALAAGVDIWLEEAALPVDDKVKGITELLGLDPLYLANEGKLLAVVDPGEVNAVLGAIKEKVPAGKACVIGEVHRGKGNVYLKTVLGGTRNL